MAPLPNNPVVFLINQKAGDTGLNLADSLLEGSDLAAKMSADDILALLQDEWQAQKTI